MQKTCIICGEPFEPYAPLRDRQICCSKQCGRKRNAELQREYEKTSKMKKYRAEYYKERTKNKTLCGICGKPTVAEDTTHKPQYHLECILNESIEVYKSGQILTDAQYLRLYSRGYSMKDIKRIVRERENNERKCKSP